MTVTLEEITAKVNQAITELLDIAKLKPGEIVVVGTSSSEIMGKKIGSDSSMEVAEAVFKGIYPVILERQLFLAGQCCEHLNRALVVEAACAEKYGLEIVTVIPWLKAGGGWATACMQNFQEPVVVESIKGHSALDIGDTLIGMHLRPVVVPVRLAVREVGFAHVTAARTRPKLIGGERARYK